jgi:hypothetical protein
MNRMNDLENEFRSWLPRQASAKLKRKIFAGLAGRVEPGGSFNWLAPALACMFLAFVVFNEENGISFTSGASRAMVAMVLSNGSSASYLPGSFDRTHNNVSVDTFDWTNSGHSSFSMRSLWPGKTND